ncbi:MAG: glycoside hydrolase family 2 TIM barrel-domain containing protein [Planctomycetota bacterium]
MRDILEFDRQWRFHLGAAPADALRWGNHNLIADETRIWQKAGNHSISRPDNPFVENWRTVDLPHDFVIEGEFTPDAPLGNGSLAGDEAWYVKAFDLPASDQGRRIRIEFDGVYRDCNVFCNGHFVGRHLSGYTSFGLDITDVCRFGGANALAVGVDARENELWSYEGGGIYRGVRMVKTDAVSVPQWGVAVTTGDASSSGETHVQVTVANAGYADADAAVQVEVRDPDGQAVATAEQALAVPAIGEAVLDETLAVASPRLWSVDEPTLYTVVCTVMVNGQAVDRVEQAFGYRYFHFDSNEGFFLNGQGLKLKGTCCHQDHGGVGVAVPPDLQAWRVRQLKEMGCNAIRTSHNPPDPALLDACDRLGILVMDEIRVPGISPEHIEEVTSLVKRDRNHPSVILWSLGNEEMLIQDDAIGFAVLRRLHEIVKRLDPSRLTTYACNCDWINICDHQREAGLMFDVFGTNYRSSQRSANYDDFHAKHPDWPMLGSETWGSASTRGLYESDGCPLGGRWADDGWADDRRFVAADGNWATPWGYSIEEMWRDCASRPFMAGTFVWTGFDYRGETSPYDWPSVITRYGLLDLCGNPKEVSQYLRAWWRPDVPHVFLLPHWNWAGKEGEAIRVRCYANTAEVDLLLNGESLGRRPMPPLDRIDWQVPYEPGTLEAVGYDAAGQEIGRYAVRTAGPPAGVEIAIDTEGEIVVANVVVVDAEGAICPKADDTVEFTVPDGLELLGVGNGNPISLEPDRGVTTRRAFHGRCQAIFKATSPHADTGAVSAYLAESAPV